MPIQFPKSESLVPLQSPNSLIFNQNAPPEQAPASAPCPEPPYYRPISIIPISSDDPATQAAIFAEIQKEFPLIDKAPVCCKEPSPSEPSIEQTSTSALSAFPAPPAIIPSSDCPPLINALQSVQAPIYTPTISSKRPADNSPIRSPSAPPNVPADGEEVFRLFGCTPQAPSFTASTARAASEYEVMEKAASVITFVNVGGNIYYFNGICYELLQQAEALGKILDVCRGDIKDAGKYTLLKNAYQFLTVDSRFRPPDEWMNQGRDYVTFLNGNLNWRSGCCEPHCSGVFTTYSIQANYLGPNAVLTNSRFMSFLSQIGGGSVELIERVLQIIGYCLVPDTGGKSGFLFQGVSDSGKSLLCSFLSSFFPKEKVSALSIHDLGQRFAASELENAALCTTPDMPSQPLGEKATSLIKSLSGNDLIQADRKYKSHAKFQFKGKFVMSSNHALFPKDRDPAFENRIVTVPFLYSLPRQVQDPQLLEKLNLERDYAASISIDAYFRLRENNYLFAGNFRMNMPEALSDSATSPELGEMITAFLLTSFVPDPDSRVFVSEAYPLFCRQFHQAPTPALFGRHFVAAASRLHNGTHMRKRIQPGENPVSCIYGIRLLQTNGENGGDT